MTDQAITLQNISGKTILVGITYFDLSGEVLDQKQLAGTVCKVTEEDGITVQDLKQESEFTIPSSLRPWFIAPPGDYHDPISGKQVQNPDYLVTWDVYKTKESTPKANMNGGNGDHSSPTLASAKSNQ